MKIKGKYINRGTIITVVSIIVLTLATMNVSYSSFFSVQTQTNVPVITAGNLDVTAKINQDIKKEELMPSTTYQAITGPSVAIQGDDFSKSTLTITNNSNINTRIGISLKNAASNDNAALASVVIAVQKDGSWIKFGSSNNYYLSLANFTASSDGSIPIIAENLASKASPVYTIYMWLADSTSEDEVDKVLNYNVTVKAVPQEGQNTDNQVTNVTTK